LTLIHNSVPGCASGRRRAFLRLLQPASATPRQQRDDIQAVEASLAGCVSKRSQSWQVAVWYAGRTPAGYCASVDADFSGQASISPGQAGYDRSEQIQMPNLRGTVVSLVGLWAVTAGRDPTPFHEGVQLGGGYTSPAVPLGDSDPFPFNQTEEAASGPSATPDTTSNSPAAKPPTPTPAAGNRDRTPSSSPRRSAKYRQPFVRRFVLRRIRYCRLDRGSARAAG
jgi:hypothetical protein